MVAGRKPKTTNTRRIHRSNDELEKRTATTPVYQSQKFLAPTTLTEKELVVWNWLVGIFKETVNCRVSDADVHLMEMYCRAKVATDEADAELKNDNRYYIIVPLGKDRNGEVRTTAKPNPNIKKRLENANLCIKLFDQLGLSPVARARAGIEAANANKGLDVFKKLMERNDD